MSTSRLGLLAPGVLPFLLAVSAPAQDATSAASVQRLDAVDHAARMERIAVTGDLGLPPLPPVLPDSPRDDIRFADRFPVNSSYEGACNGTGPTIISQWIPPSVTGSGKAEFFQYMIPTGYDAGGAPVPLVIGYHGYGASANSVALQSTLDEECDARGWFYLAPTGLDDQLFGSLPCQANIEASIHWLLDRFNIDPDRIYMAGYSMGAGVVANFAARHRDPDDIMIAAIATTCGTFDWTLAYSVESPALLELLENPYNFGGTPEEFPFSYQRSSSVYFPPETYQPSAIDYDSKLSMGSNLWDVPAYVSFDSADVIFSVRVESQAFINLLAESGIPPVTQIETGTVDPCNGNPATHSWAVFDMPAVFAFFDGKVVDRHPVAIDAQLDRSAKVSYLEVTQAATEAFTWLTADASAGLVLGDVENAGLIDVDASLAGAGLAGAGPHAIQDVVADALDHTLRLRGFDAPAAYLLDGTTSAYVEGSTSDPATGALLHDVGLDGLDVDLVTNDVWTGKVFTTPDPVAPGAATQVEIDMPDTSSGVGYIVLGFSEGLVTVKGGNKITAWPFTPSLLLQVPFDPNGDLSLPFPVPNDPGLSGLEVFLQCIGLDGSSIDAITNMWVMHVE